MFSDALELSDEEVDPPLRSDAPQYESKAILVPETDTKSDMRSTLKGKADVLLYLQFLFWSILGIICGHTSGFNFLNIHVMCLFDVIVG